MSDGFSEFGLLQRMDGVSGGQVCLRDSGVLVEFIAGLYTAGESIIDLAKNYGRKPEDIEAAIRLVLYARGCNLSSKRAATRVDRVIPLLRNRQSDAKGRNSLDGI